jgi:hypothetical protein
MVDVAMYKKISGYIETLYSECTVNTCIMVAVFIFFIDYITGKSIHFPIFYVLPVGMASWKGHMKTAYALSFLLPSFRIGFHFPWHETESLFEVLVNTFIRIFALFLYTYLVSRVAWQTRALENKVKILESILPICSVCKRIRNENGDYEQIEKYITERSEASFSHGLCKECLKKLYGEYLGE